MKVTEKPAIAPTYKIWENFSSVLFKGHFEHQKLHKIIQGEY